MELIILDLYDLLKKKDQKLEICVEKVEDYIRTTFDYEISITAFISYLMFLKANNITLKTFEMLKTPSEMLGLIGAGQASVLGIQVSDMGVFKGCKLYICSNES